MQQNYILSKASMAMIALPLMTIIPICCDESDASSRTRFMNGSNPRTIPLTVREPLSRTRKILKIVNRSCTFKVFYVELNFNLPATCLSMYFFSSGGYTLVMITDLFDYYTSSDHVGTHQSREKSRYHVFSPVGAMR